MFISAKKIIKLSCCFLGIGLFANSAIAQTDPIFVDKELMLEVDLSGSIDSTEYQQIITGYSNAFQNPTIQDEIEALSDGVAVGMQFFASGQTQMVSNAFEYLFTDNYDETNAGNTAINSHFGVNTQWYILQTAEDANQFANLLNNLIVRRPDTGGDAFSTNSGLCGTEEFNDNNATGIGTGTNIAGAIQQGTCEINSVNQRYSTYIDLNGDGIVDSDNPLALRSGTAKIIASYEQAIDISSDGIQNTLIDGTTAGTNATCNDTLANQIICQDQLELAQLQSANLGRTDGNINNGIENSTDYEWDNPITRINGLPVNNDVAYETEYFRDGYLQPNEEGTSHYIGAVVGGVNKGATTEISDNTFDTGEGVNGSFVVSADDYGAFQPAIILKLQNELEPVPFEFKPGFGLLLGLGIFGLRRWFSQKSDNKKTVSLDSKTKDENDNNQVVMQKKEPVLIS